MSFTRRGRDVDNEVQLVVLIPRILLDILAPMFGGGVHVYYIKRIKRLHVRCDNEQVLLLRFKLRAKTGLQRALSKGLLGRPP